MNKNEILETLKEHKSYIQKNFAVAKIGLFGSYAKEKQKEDSDIDFYVEFEHKTFDNLAGLWVYLEALYHNKIDIIHKHKANINELLKFIQKSIILIKRRFVGIHSGDDFLEDDEGIDKLDAISMRLQSIGEAIKNIDKREQSFLLKVADKSYWSKIIKTREILTHHYIEIDAETIYEICHDKLDELEAHIEELQKHLDNNR